MMSLTRRTGYQTKLLHRGEPEWRGPQWTGKISGAHATQAFEFAVRMASYSKNPLVESASVIRFMVGNLRLSVRTTTQELPEACPILRTDR